MTINHLLIRLFSLFLLSGILLGQNKKENKIFQSKISKNLINPKNGLIRCASTEYELFLQSKYTNRDTEQQFEKWISHKTDKIKKALKSGKYTNDTLIIPVVVHIIHKDKAIGENENISDERVFSQITVLNQDYLRIINTPGYNNNPIGANVGIEFKLAIVDPKGNPTNGIDRISLKNYIWDTDNVEKILKPKTQWDPNKYFNIWVCEFDDSGDLKNTLGYAQFPSGSKLDGLENLDGIAATDGVILDWRAFGSSNNKTDIYYSGYNKGRTLTHEIGHALGLRHIWGDNSLCTVDATDSKNDYCLDTPAAAAPNYSCITIEDSCPNEPGNDMTENYMDYCNDTCFNTFTLDQKARILAVLKNSPRRASLTTSEVWKTPQKVNIAEGIQLYPNPAINELNIKFSDSNRVATSYKIFNNVGLLIRKDVIDSKTEFQINTSNLISNTYILEVKTNKGTAKFKFIVSR